MEKETRATKKEPTPAAGKAQSVGLPVMMSVADADIIVLPVFAEGQLPAKPAVAVEESIQGWT